MTIQFPSGVLPATQILSSSPDKRPCSILRQAGSLRFAWHPLAPSARHSISLTEGQGPNLRPKALLSMAGTSSLRVSYSSP